MTHNSTIAIICNKTSTIDFVTSKLALLRNVDKVGFVYINALEQLKLKIPNVIIMYAEDVYNESLSLLSNIKKDIVLKNIPVIFLGENLNQEFFIKAYENGASEIIVGEIKEYELLIRTMWAFKNSETEKSLQTIKNQLNSALENASNIDNLPFLLVSDLTTAPVKIEQTKIEPLKTGNPQKKLKTLKVRNKLKSLKNSPITNAEGIEIPSSEQSEAERNSLLFKQAFKRKTSIIIEPLFKKYGNLIKEKIKNTVIDGVFEPERCELSLAHSEITSSLLITHADFSKIEINIVHIVGKDKKIKRTSMELTDLDFEKLSKIIAILIGEFRKNLEK